MVFLCAFLPGVNQCKRLHRGTVAPCTVHQVQALHCWSWWHRHACQHGRELLRWFTHFAANYAP